MRLDLLSYIDCLVIIVPITCRTWWVDGQSDCLLNSLKRVGSRADVVARVLVIGREEGEPQPSRLTCELGNNNCLLQDERGNI